MEEPFGRTSLEAASRGCAVIISDRGGLKETITDGIIVKKVDSKNFQKSINKLILNDSLMKRYQSNSIKNFYLTNVLASNKIDNYREELIKFNLQSKINKIKILHITNLNEKHNVGFLQHG